MLVGFDFCNDQLKNYNITKVIFHYYLKYIIIIIERFAFVSLEVYKKDVYLYLR